MSFVQEPGGFLPYNRTAELESFISVLLHTTLMQDKSYSDIISEARETLKAYPIAEIVPQLFYDFHERHSGIHSNAG